MSVQYKPGNWVKMENSKYYLGFGWEFETQDKTDLDGYMAAFNEAHERVDIIYFNRLEGLNGSIKHFGDNRTGAGEGDNEVMLFDLGNIPQNVVFLTVAIGSYTARGITAAKTAYIRISRESDKKEIGRFDFPTPISGPKDTGAFLVGLFERRPNSPDWYFQVMIEPLEGTCKPIQSCPVLQTKLPFYHLPEEKQSTVLRAKKAPKEDSDDGVWMFCDHRSEIEAIGEDELKNNLEGITINTDEDGEELSKKVSSAISDALSAKYSRIKFFILTIIVRNTGGVNIHIYLESLIEKNKDGSTFIKFDGDGFFAQSYICVVPI